MFVAWFSIMLALWVIWWLHWAFQGTCLGSLTLHIPFFCEHMMQYADQAKFLGQAWLATNAAYGIPCSFEVFRSKDLRVS